VALVEIGQTGERLHRALVDLELLEPRQVDEGTVIGSGRLRLALAVLLRCRLRAPLSDELHPIADPDPEALEPGLEARMGDGRLRHTGGERDHVVGDGRLGPASLLDTLDAGEDALDREALVLEIVRRGRAVAKPTPPARVVAAGHFVR
jgi:hypothetical protein